MEDVTLPTGESIKGTYVNSVTGFKLIINEIAPKPETFSGEFIGYNYTDAILGTFKLNNGWLKFTKISFSSESDEDNMSIVGYGQKNIVGDTAFKLTFTITKGNDNNQFTQLPFRRI